MLANPGEFDVFEDQVIGRGETSILCRGRRRAENHKVSIKLLSDSVKVSAEDLQRCREESAAIGAARDANIVPVVGSGVWKGRRYFAMEDVEGETLAGYLQSGYRFSTLEILAVAEGVGRALQAAEEAGLVHGAVRPSNILLTTAGKVLLAGFGTKRMVRSSSSLSALRYVAPEQIRRDKLTFETDLYSLGVVLYELATGKTPFDGFESTTSLLYQVAHVDPPSTRQMGSLIPLDLDRLILRCLQKDRENRCTAPDAFLADIASIRESLQKSDAAGLATDDPGDFEIYEDQVVGEGGMGTLYKGKQISLGRMVAIKVIRGILTANPDCLQRFRREGELLAQVNDPSVVQVFGTGTWKGRLYYAMELVEGEDLATAVAKGKTHTWSEILDVAEGVALALKAAWAFKIIHRDIKPSNILITPEKRVKVADFGLAKSLRFPRTDSQLIAGTSEYISPEQAMGVRVDIRTDLYSLGVVMYELVSGKPPFHSDDSYMGIIYQHVHTPPPPLKSLVRTVPEALAALIHRCLNKDPKDRFRNPDQFLEELANVRRTLGAPGPRPKLLGWARRLRQNKRTLLAEGSVLLVILATSLAVWAGLTGRPDDGFRSAYELATDLGDFASAMAIAERGPGRQSTEYRSAERRLRERRAVACLQREDWESAATLFRSLEADATGAEQSRCARAREYCEDLAKGRRLEETGDAPQAQAIYRRLLAQEPVHEAYLKQRLELLQRSPR